MREIPVQERNTLNEPDSEIDSCLDLDPSQELGRVVEALDQLREVGASKMRSIARLRT